MIRTRFRDLQWFSSHMAKLSLSQVNDAYFISRSQIHSKGTRDKSPKRTITKRKRVRVKMQDFLEEKKVDLEKKVKMFVPVKVEPCTKDNDEEDIGVELAGSITSAQKSKIFKSFYVDDSTEMLANQHGIEGYIRKNALASFRKYCISSTQLPVELHIVFSDLAHNHGHVSDLFPFFLSHAKKVFPHLDCMEDLQKISDLTDPSQWYPLARTMQRKVIFHAGPTNSGKTYHALKQFMESNSGVYCGPLRLLAMEVFDKCDQAGVACDLITGETRRYANEDETASGHVACTVEMASLNQEYDVAVIDEIQMLGDLQRGWSWTRALLGIAAKELHVCGEETAIDLVENLLYSTGDSFEVRRYERLTSLTYLDEALGTFDKIRPGDCIVCFSKKDIFKISHLLTRKGYFSAMIYGDLPPGTKIAQSRKFNDPNDKTDVLVATDAIGMGLNLAIKRIIFYSVRKICLKDDNTRVLDYISTSQAQQIGGRAGRFRTQYEDGEVTTFWPTDLKILHSIVNMEKCNLEKAGLHPSIEMIEMFSYHLPKASLSNIIDIFIHVCKLDDLYFMCYLLEFQQLGKLIEHIPLPLRTQCVLCSSPLKIKKNKVQVMFVKIATQMSKGIPLTYEWLCTALGAPFRIPQSISQLEQLESAFDVVDIYLWLSYRYPDLFVDADEVRQLRLIVDSIIQTYLNIGGSKGKGSLLSEILEKDSLDKESITDNVDGVLIQESPLQAYTPKPKPKSETEKYKIFADAYRELERMEEQTKDESEYLNDSLIAKEINVSTQHEENTYFGMDNQFEEEKKKLEMENQFKGFLSSDSSLYSQVAGKYQSKIQSVEDKGESPVVVKEGKSDVMDQGETYVGMDEEEVERLKKILTVSKEIRNRNMKSAQSPLMNLKEVEKFTNLVSSKKEEPNLNSFVHIYPKKAKVKRKHKVDSDRSINEQHVDNEGISNPLGPTTVENSDSDIDNLDYDNIQRDLDHRNNASTELEGKESVEKNLLETGVLTEEMLAKLKSEWAKSAQKVGIEYKDTDNTDK